MFSQKVLLFNIRKSASNKWLVVRRLTGNNFQFVAWKLAAIAL